MIEDRAWYVVAIDKPDPERDIGGFTYVFGPFVLGGETDARAYALDLGIDEEGFDSISAIEMTHDIATNLSGDGKVKWPYSEGGPDDGEL